MGPLYHSQKVHLFLLFILYSMGINATELKPWFGPDKQLLFRSSYCFQAYQDVDTIIGTQHHFSRDHFMSLGLEISPTNDLDVEIELNAAKTTQHSFNLNDERITARYLLLNDDLGDIASLTFGMTAMHVQPTALHDISTFYHGKGQLEVHSALGRQVFCESFWTSRFWTVFGAGMGTQGSLWIRGELAWEKNWWDAQTFRLFANTLWGLGRKPLNLDIPFEGYGAIQHQSIDFGWRYSYLFPSAGLFSFEYCYRVYARNAPKWVNSFMINFLMPIPLGI